MTPCSLLRQTAARFREAGIPDPETDSSLLLSSLCHRPPLLLRLDLDTELDETTLQTFSSLAARRLNREPLQYILGEVSFCGLLFHVDPRVLIPRPETALLADWASDLLEGCPDPRVLDLCCGSGCIGLTLASRCPNANVTLSDCSRDALDVASENARRLSLHVSLHRGDLTENLPDRFFDLIVSNPPYIPTPECARLQPEVLHEPLLALDGGMDGLSFYRRIVLESCRVLKPGGQLLMELGWQEAAAVSGLLEAAGFSGITVRQDLNGLDRMILAIFSSSEEVCSTI